MKLKYLLDVLTSNLIVYASYTLTILIWSYLFYNFAHYANFLLCYFPYGIIVIAFLFFGNKIIFGLLLSQISFYLIIAYYNLNLPFNNFFSISACQLVCVPLTLFFLQKYNITVGAGENYKFNKTNIFHVLFFSFYSTIMLGIVIVVASFFFYNQTDLLIFTIGHFIGAFILIVLMKIIVNIPNVMKNLIKSN